MRILVVDDDRTVRAVMRRILENQGHEVHEAADGKDALALLEREPFPLVIADWLMPELDGIGLTRRIRRDARGVPDAPYTYVILLTSKDARDDRIQGFEAGADDFLVKPPTPDEISARLTVAARILEMESQLREANRLLDQRRQDEIRIGGAIQRALLMAQPPDAALRFEFAVMNLPSSQIDGDFFDFFVHQPGVVDVFVGDAMGKGVPAALVGAGTKSFMLRALGTLLADHTRDGLPSPVEIVQNVADGLSEQLIRLASFVTLSYARLDVNANRAVFVDAGHTKTLHLRDADGSCEAIDGGNFPIGFLEDESYREVEVAFAPGDLFCFYSDGVTEAQGPDRELFGSERLVALLQAHRDDSPSQLLYRLREAVREHTRGRPLDDDFTCIMVRVGRAVERFERRERRMPSALDALAELRSFVGECAVACRLDGQGLDRLLVAVQEAASNIVRHTHRGEGGELTAVCAAIPGGIRVELRASGPPFSPGPVPKTFQVGIETEGGMGLFLIHHNVDRVEYDHDPERGEFVVRMDRLSA